MANERDVLAVDLEIAGEQTAGSKVDAFYQKLLATETAINELGKDSPFAKDFSAKLADVQKRAETTRATLANVGRFDTKTNSLDGLSLAAIRLQKETAAVKARLQDIKSVDTKGKDVSFLKILADDAATAEIRLEKLEKRATDFQQRRAAQANAARKPGAGAEFGNGVVDGLGIPTAAAAGAAVGAGLIALGKESIDAAREAANAQLILRASAKETGISYDKLAESARKFGNDTLQSNRQAQATFAQIVTFANAAGRSDKIDEFRKRFADLAAAKGIEPERLGEIAKQLNALTDEATDKLLNGNPSAFYDKFAQSIHKTAEQLTDAEKRAAIFDEVLRRGLIFNGEAEKRINSSATAVDRMTKSFEDSKAGLGKALLPLVEFVEFTTKVPGAIASAFSSAASSNDFLKKLSTEPLAIPVSMVLNLADNATRKIADLLFGNDVQREIAISVKFSQATQDNQRIVDLLRASDKQIKDAQANPFASLSNFALSKVQLENGFFDAKARQKSIDDATKDATKFVDDLQKRLSKVDNAGGNLGILKQARAEFQQFQFLFDNDTREKLRNSIDSAISEGAARGFNKLLQNSQTPLQQLRDALKQIANNADLTTQTRTDLTRDFTQKIAASVKEGKDKVAELEKTTTSFFEGLAAKSGANNPFVAVFNEADLAMQNVRLTTAALDKDLQATAARLQQNISASALFSTRLETGLQALALRDDAAKFRATSGGADSTGVPDKLFNDIVQRAVSRFNDGAFHNDFAGSLARNAAEQKRQLNFGEQFDIFSNERLNQLTPGTNDFNSRVSDLARERLRRQNALTNNGVSEDTTGDVQARLQRQLEFINSQKATDDTQRSIADKKIIALTQGLNPADLTTSERNAAAAARENEAARLEQSEQKAVADRAEQIRLQASIEKNMKKLADLAEKEGGLGVIKIINEATDRAKVSLGKQPTSNDTQKMMNR